MPLMRYALYAQGVDVYIAPTYDTGETWVATLRHIAREGGCWVLGSGCAFRGSDVPDTLPELRALYPDPDEWVNPGGSIVVAPDGKLLTGPMRNEVGILYADLDPGQVVSARRSLDVVGHYARPDIFALEVNARAMTPAQFRE